MSIAEKLITIAQNEQRVYDAGVNTGTAKGSSAEYDRFWDEYQRNGARLVYYFAFAGAGWKDETFKPKYNITMKNSALSAFQYCEVTDIVQSLKECGIILDTSGANTLQTAFAYAITKRLPVINASSATSIQGLFSGCKKLESIEKFVTKKDLMYTGTFSNCVSLKDIVFEGEIGNDLNLGASTLLSADSIKSVIGCLSDSVTGKTLTLSKIALANAFNFTEAASQEWLALIATKQNWTISQV